MKASTAILFALLALGGYLLYRSLANLGSSLASLPGATASALGSGVSSLGTSAYNTLGSEFSALSSALGNPVGSLSSIGAWLTSGSTTTPSLGDLSGITSPTLTLPDASLGGGLSLGSGDGSGGNITVPVDGGTLSFGNLPSLPDTTSDPIGSLQSDGGLPTWSDTDPGEISGDFGPDVSNLTDGLGISGL